MFFDPFRPRPPTCDPRVVGNLTKVGLGAAAIGVAGLGYSLLEARSYRLRRVDVPVLPTGSPPLRVLHLSDLHMTPNQRRKRDWVRRLASLSPDAVVVTGDFLAHQESVPYALEVLEPLLDKPGAFVLGSNDYYEPTLKNPIRYLLPDVGRRIQGRMLPWTDLTRGLSGSGWLDLSNARGVLKVDGREIDIRGVDDPHIKRDDYGQVSGAFDAGADLSLGVTHAPYLRILDAMAADGAGLILAGHTHGGQLCLPGIGALVTNCDLDRRRAKGLHRYAKPFNPTDSTQSDPSLGGVDGRGTWLHVSAGLGTNPYTPVRFFCPPEATLLTLTSTG